MDSITVTVSEESITMCERFELEGLEVRDNISGVPTEVIKGPGDYQCINGNWSKVVKP